MNTIINKICKAVLAIGVVTLTMVQTTANASLIDKWNFDETGGTTAYNSVAGGLNGTLVGGVAFTSTSGVFDRVIDITTGYVDMGGQIPASPTFSVEAWVEIATGDTSGMTPVAQHWSTIPAGYFLSINNIGDGYTQTNTEGFFSVNYASHQTAVGGPPIDDGLWHELVGVYDNGVASIYVDGNLAGTGWGGYSTGSADFMVGGIFNSSGTPQNLFQGLIGEVSVYNNALSASQVEALYQSYQTPQTPIPAALWMVGTALVGVGFFGRHRKISL